MEQLRADLRRVKEEFRNLRSITTSFFGSLHSQQDAQSRLQTTRQQTGQLQPTSSAKTLERSLLDAYSQFERHLEGLDRKIENALSSANTSSNADAPARDTSSDADSAPAGNAPSRAHSPSTGNTSPSADTPPACDTPCNAHPPLIGDGSLRANSPHGAGAPPAREIPAGANSLIGDTSRTPLPSLRQPAQVSSSPPDGPSDHNTPKPTFTLKLADLGERLIPRLQTFIQDNNFASKLFVEDIESITTALTDAVQPLNSPGLDTQFEVAHQLDKDIWHLYSDPSKELRLPDLANVTKPSVEDVEQYLEDLYQNLPGEPISYYVGPLSGSVAGQLQSHFPSGYEVSQLGDVPGVSTLFGHVGGEASGTVFHCEDANLRSCNLTLIGWKIWILIKPHHTANFENLVRRLTNCDDSCDQFVRHASVIVHPSRLRTENIEFDVFCSGPGEMVLTQPRQYHAVINRTASFAIATNFVLPNENPIPERLSLCHLDGLYHLEHRMIRKLRHSKRKEHDSQLETRLPRKKRSLHKPLDTFVVEVLVRETTSRDAILRFMTVVRAWRRAGDNIRGRLLQIGQCDESHRLSALDTLRMDCRENSQLYSFLEILASVHLVRNLERRIAIIAPESIDKLMGVRKLRDTKQNRKSVKNELAAYQKWDQLCGATPAYTYEGILCFVPPVFKDYQEVTRTQVQRLGKNDIALFCSMLQEVEYIQRLCNVGRAFQMGIFGSAEFTERPFEAQPHGNLSTLGLADLLRLL